MALTPRVKKYTDYSYLVTNPASEDDVRAQMDGAVQEVFDTVQSEVPLKTDLGVLASLTTTVKTSAVAAINELDAEMGVLSSLQTTNKTSLVAAVNEVRTENRTAPTEVVVSTGFSAGWSGEVRYRINKEGLKTVGLVVERSTDILTSAETIITIPAIASTYSFGFGAMSSLWLASFSGRVSGAAAEIKIDGSGNVRIASVGSVTATAKSVNGFVTSYY